MSYIAVIGAGSWGTTLACLLQEKEYDVALWAFEKEVADEINSANTNSVYFPGENIQQGALRRQAALKRRSKMPAIF